MTYFVDYQMTNKVSYVQILPISYILGHIHAQTFQNAVAP